MQRDVDQRQDDDNMKRPPGPRGRTDGDVHQAVHSFDEGFRSQLNQLSVEYSVVAAIQNLWLAARSVGVGVGWVSILRPTQVRKILAVPESWTLIAYLCVGYPKHEVESIPELQRRGWERRADLSTHWIKR